MISIIIPCFNAASSLREAYDTLPLQEERPGGHDLQIILVDDGSTDGTRDLIMQLVSEDIRIKPVFREQNVGVSEARNAALDASDGSLIFFMDADDKLAEGALDTLAQYMTPDVDFVRGKHLLWDVQTGRLRENDGEERNFSELYAIAPKAFPQISAVYSSWNALMRKSVIDKLGLRFPIDLHIGEDRLFNFLYLMACRKITFLNDYTYLWRRNASEGTQATQVLVKKPDQMFYSIRRVVALLADKWFQEHPVHRRVLASQMLMELCNNISGFSRQIEQGDLPDGVKDDIDWSIANLNPDWINLDGRNLKGRIETYLPLYNLVSRFVGKHPDEGVYREISRTLGKIRRELNEKTTGNATQASIEQEQQSIESDEHEDLVARIFSAARGFRSSETLIVESFLLEKSGMFDAQYYAAKYPDVEKLGLNALQHFLELGAGEQRLPNDWFNTKAYFMHNPHLVLGGINPLVHHYKRSLYS